MVQGDRLGGISGDSRLRGLAASVVTFLITGGCGSALAPAPAQRLFYLPLVVNGVDLGSAFIDTGGEFEVLLEDPLDLEYRAEVDILAFAGREKVSVTEPFIYSVGDLTLYSEGAIVGIAACKCNGIGLGFLHKVDRVLALNFHTREATLLPDAPTSALQIPVSTPDGRLGLFQGVFIDVQVGSGDSARLVHGLLDTGATHTVMRRGIAGGGTLLQPDLEQVTLENIYLGKARFTVGLFDTEGLPDLIIGTDLMGAWAKQWYMSFDGASRSLWVEDTLPPRDGSGEGGQATLAEAGA